MHTVVPEPARTAPAEDHDLLADAECDSNVGGGLFDGIDFSGCHHESSRRCQAADRAQVARAEPPAFARGHEPQLLSSLALHWPALARWSSPTVLSALMELSDGPGTDVLVLRSENEGRFLKSDCLQERWPPARVVRHLFSSPAPSSGPAAGAENQATETVRLAADGIYARTPLTEQALADCDLKVLEAMMGQPAQVANCGVWIGSASNITPFHYDLCHGFLVQPAEWKCMYPRDLSPELSHVDFESWRGRCGPEAASRERQRYPNFERAELRSVTLRPGDVIYTPPYWWHHVETSGEAAAVSVLVPFDQSKEEAATLGEGSSHYLIHYR